MYIHIHIHCATPRDRETRSRASACSARVIERAPWWSPSWHDHDHDHDHDHRSRQARWPPIPWTPPPANNRRPPNTDSSNIDNVRRAPRGTRRQPNLTLTRSPSTAGIPTSTSSPHIHSTKPAQHAGRQGPLWRGGRCCSDGNAPGPSPWRPPGSRRAGARSCVIARGRTASAGEPGRGGECVSYYL